MKIVFAGTPEFAKVQLEALLTTQHDIVAVYTQPDKPAGRGQQLHESAVKTLAQAQHLPVEQPISLKSSDAFEKLQHYAPDVIIVAAYGLILPKNIIDHFCCINVHASILPQWRGAAPIQRAIMRGDKTTGITLMRMNEGLDTGNILVTAKCDIQEDDTSATLHDKLAHLGAQLLIEKLDSIIHEQGTSQDNTKATLARKITKADGQLDWDQSSEELSRKIRAFNPWPIAFCNIASTVLRIWQAMPVAVSEQKKPGTILEQKPQGLLVATGQGGLLITQAQLPGKKVLPFSEILKSHRDLFAVGKTLSDVTAQLKPKSPDQSAS